MKIKQLIDELEKIVKESPEAEVSIAIFDSGAGIGRRIDDVFRVEHVDTEEVYLEMDVAGGTLKINVEYSEIGNCSRYWQQEVKVVHKIVDNTSSMECDVEGKRYKTCEEGCPIWKSNEGLND
jgi:hypothetical protein